MDSELLAILACPKCRGSLTPVERSTEQPMEQPTVQKDTQGLSCPACSLVYPILEGIPVLLIEEAIAESDWPKYSRHITSPCQAASW